MVEVKVEISFSKIMALLVLVGAFTLDVLNDRNGTVFMFSLPFVVTLISWKQYLDKGIQK